MLHFEPEFILNALASRYYQIIQVYYIMLKAILFNIYNKSKKLEKKGRSNGDIINKMSLCLCPFHILKNKDKKFFLLIRLMVSTKTGHEMESTLAGIVKIVNQEV